MADARDARPAARPAQHAPRLRAARSRPWPTSPTCIVPELWHHDSIGAMAEAALDAAPPTLRARRLLDGRLCLLRDPAPRARAGRAAGADGHPGHARHAGGHGAPPRLDRADPASAASMACSPRCCRTIVHRRHLDDPAIIQPILDMAARDRRRRLLPRADGDHRPARQPAAAGRDRHADRGDRRPPGPGDAAGRAPRRWRPTSPMSRLVVLEECGHMARWRSRPKSRPHSGDG